MNISNDQIYDRYKAIPSVVLSQYVKLYERILRKVTQYSSRDKSGKEHSSLDQLTLLISQCYLYRFDSYHVRELVKAVHAWVRRDFKQILLRERLLTPQALARTILNNLQADIQSQRINEDYLVWLIETDLYSEFLNLQLEQADKNVSLFFEIQHSGSIFGSKAIISFLIISLPILF